MTFGEVIGSNIFSERITEVVLWGGIDVVVVGIKGNFISDNSMVERCKGGGGSSRVACLCGGNWVAQRNSVVYYF